MAVVVGTWGEQGVIRCFWGWKGYTYNNNMFGKPLPGGFDAASLITPKTRVFHSPENYVFNVYLTQQTLSSKLTSS